MNLNDVQVFLDTEIAKGNEDVKSYLSELVPVTNESATQFLETEEGKKFLQPMLDKYHDKSLKSWQANNLDKLVDERTAARIKELHPNESPEQREIKELKSKLESQQKELQHASLKENVLKNIRDKGISVNLADMIIGVDEETSIKNIELLESELKIMANKEIERRLAGGYQPPEAQYNNVSDLNDLGMDDYIKKRKEKG